MITGLTKGDILTLKSIPITGFTYSTGLEVFYVSTKENSDIVISLDIRYIKKMTIPYHAVIKAVDHLTNKVIYLRDPGCAL